MFRWLAVCLVLCLGTFVLMNMALGEKGMSILRFPKWFKSDDTKPLAENGSNKRGEENAEVVYLPATDRANGQAALVIHEARIQVVNKQDVSSERDGTLLFFATELRPGDGYDPKRLKEEGKLIEYKLGYLYVPEKKGDEKDGKYRRFNRDTDTLDPESVRLAMVPQYFRKLELGDRVKEGDLLALVKPALALEDLNVKQSKFKAAELDRIASEKTRDEAKARWDAMTNSRRAVRNSVSEDDWRGARLTYERYIQEEKAKGQAREQAESELMAAETTVRMHEIRALCSGVVKVIYKNPGDAVKNLEPVMHIEDPTQLRVEGVVEVQDTRQLAKGMPVSVEPTQLEAPRRKLSGHTQEVNCVAVTKGPRMLIVSGSEDRSLRIWDSVTGQELGALMHPSGVRAVACTGPQCQTHNLALTGTANGIVRLFNLDRLQDKPIELTPGHQSAVTSVAFSPDGQFCLTASEDRSVVVWRLKDEGGMLTPERLHAVPAAHRYAVTSVQFIYATPDRVQFLTVGRDSRALVWTMENDKEPEAHDGVRPAQRHGGDPGHRRRPCAARPGRGAAAPLAQGQEPH